VTPVRRALGREAAPRGASRLRLGAPPSTSSSLSPLPPPLTLSEPTPLSLYEEEPPPREGSKDASSLLSPEPAGASIHSLGAPPERRAEPDMGRQPQGKRGMRHAEAEALAQRAKLARRRRRRQKPKSQNAPYLLPRSRPVSFWVRQLRFELSRETSDWNHVLR